MAKHMMEQSRSLNSLLEMVLQRVGGQERGCRADAAEGWS